MADSTDVLTSPMELDSSYSPTSPPASQLANDSASGIKSHAIGISSATSNSTSLPTAASIASYDNSLEALSTTLSTPSSTDLIVEDTFPVSLDAPEPSLITTVSSALVPYNPALFQNRSIKASPIGWTTASKSLTAFPIFNKLPAEVRLMVWELLMLSRSVRIERGCYTPSKISWIHDDAVWLTSKTPRPITLGICKESRSFTLKKYRTFFDFKLVHLNGYHHYMKLNDDQLNPDERNYIYLNPDIDSVLIDPHAWNRNLWATHSSPKDITDVKRLVLDCTLFYQATDIRWIIAVQMGLCPWNFWDETKSYLRSFASIVGNFSGLKEVHVLWNLNADWGDWSEEDPQARIATNRKEASKFALVGKKMLQEYSDTHPGWSLPTYENDFVFLESE